MTGRVQGKPAKGQMRADFFLLQDLAMENAKLVRLRKRREQLAQQETQLSNGQHDVKETLNGSSSHDPNSAV